MRNPMRSAAALLLVIGSFMARAQTAAPGQTATLHATANLVVVDVTVTDDAGNPVHGLKLADFHLSEDKAAQRIRSFEEHSLPGAPAAAPDAPKLLAGVFTNALTVPTDTPVNVLLLDTLNTPMMGQAFVHAQLVKYLNAAKPGTRMAIFGLSSRGIVMLQGLTTDLTALRLAVNHTHPQATIRADAASGTEGVMGALAAGMEAQLAVSPEMLSAIQDFNTADADTESSLTAGMTLQAINQLARYLAGIPGRKNLIWFGDSFPLSLVAPLNPGTARQEMDKRSGDTAWTPEYRETADLLARARVAIYPVDARGLTSRPGRMSDGEFEARYSMFQMAEDTGGKAFMDTNGLAQAVEKITSDGACYYTLAYTPTRSNPHGEFRTIRVELEGKGYKLAYRRGYFAEPNDTGPAASPAADKRIPAIKLAARYTAPPETQIRFFARLAAVAPATEPVLTKTAARRELAPERFRHYMIDFSVDPAALEVVEATDGLRHAHLEYLTLVYDTQGRIVGSDVKAVRATWTATQFAAAQRYGVRYQQQIAVPVDGVHTVRVLIHDLNTDRIGSIDLPVSALQPAP